MKVSILFEFAGCYHEPLIGLLLDYQDRFESYLLVLIKEDRKQLLEDGDLYIGHITQ